MVVLMSLNKAYFFMVSVLKSSGKNPAFQVHNAYLHGGVPPGEYKKKKLGSP